jgi:uncharacterized protein (TIGR02421 family)
MVWKSLKEKVHSLSTRIVRAQEPIRILNSIKIPGHIEEKLRQSNFKEIPKVDINTYRQVSVGFDFAQKRQEFLDIKQSIDMQLGKNSDLAHLLMVTVDQYLQVIELLEARGTKRFYDISRALYGSSADTMLSDKNSVFQMSRLLYSIFGGIKSTMVVPQSEKTLSAAQAVDILNERFQRSFGDEVRAVISDGILADAAAGGDRVKINSQRMFSYRDLDIYEVHEGWVHVGTSMNGRRQPVAKWLSVGPPRCTSTQEGLAVLMEIFTFKTSVHRAQRINDRIIAISKAEEGANVLELFEYFRTEGYGEEECLTNSLRILRGAPLDGGSPFTKDISYCKGFVENYNFLRTAIRANKPYLIPFLFSGKVNVEDVPLLYQLHREGLVSAPKYLPPQFQDLNGIAVWMGFSSFFNKVDLKQVQKHFNQLFRKYA